MAGRRTCRLRSRYHRDAALLVACVVAGAVQAGQAEGKALYEAGCIVCHGDDGKGAMPGVPDWTDGGGRLALPAAVLKQRVLEGFQSPGSALAMPPKGGNPALTDQDIDELLRYLGETFGGPGPTPGRPETSSAPNPPPKPLHDPNTEKPS